MRSAFEVFLQEGRAIPLIRAFVAIELPAELIRKLGELQEILKKEVKGSRSVSWPAPENIHLTLKFIGDADEGRVEEMANALIKAARGTTPIGLRTGGVGAFPALGKARVLWVGLVDPAQRLSGLHKGVEDALSAIGLEKEDRPFKPHLTLCRIRSLEDGRILGHAIEKLKDFKDMDFTVSHLVLFKSVLGPKGARYTALKRIELE